MAKQGSAAVAQFQRVVNQVSREVIGESLPSLSTEEYLQGWLDGVKRRNAPKTINRYRHIVDSFLTSLGPAAKQPVRGISPVHIERYLNGRLDAGVAPTTAVLDVKILGGGAFNRAEKFGYLDRNPVPAITFP